KFYRLNRILKSLVRISIRIGDNIVKNVNNIAIIRSIDIIANSSLIRKIETLRRLLVIGQSGGNFGNSVHRIKLIRVSISFECSLEVPRSKIFQKLKT